MSTSTVAGGPKPGSGLGSGQDLCETVVFGFIGMIGLIGLMGFIRLLGFYMVCRI